MAGSQVAARATPSPAATSGWRRQDAFFLLPVIFLWIVLIDQLHVEWSVNAQYNYGWAVPFLCAYLGWRASRQEGGKRKAESGKAETGETSNLQPPTSNVEGGEGGRFDTSPSVPLPDRGGEGSPQEGGKRKVESGGTSNIQWGGSRAGTGGRGLALGLLFLWAALYLPTRLVQEANPEWRLVSWALAMIVVGLTLVFVHCVCGLRVLRWIAFPILFFLVAVPWPTVIEGPFIQRLAAFNAAGAIEVLNLIGIPALRHGNVIEISTGLVGVEDACSGIRSFQACLMIGLFLGAYYRLRVSRRLALVGVGFLLAIVFNLGRTVLLVAVASRKGIPAIAEWHDPAGVTILVGCFLGVWALSAVLARRGGVKPVMPSAPVNRQETASLSQRRLAAALAVGLFLWLAACEAGVEFWYARHESRMSTRATWDVHLPADAPRFRELPFEDRTIQLLRFDEGRNATWTDLDGTRCQAIFLRWNPGRIAVHLARSHTPEVCLTSSGRKLTSGTEPRSVAIDGLSLAFDVYHAEREGLWVYYCLWEDGFSGDSNETERLTYRNRLRPVIEGRRNRGQRSLEIAVWSNAGADEIHARVTRLLQSVVQVKPVS